MQIRPIDRFSPLLGNADPLWIMLIAITLSGCSMIDAMFEPDPTKIELKLEASEHLNPDIQGRASPLVARLYELKSVDVFSNADFFTIYHSDTDALGADIELRKEIKLTPGETVELDFEPKPDSRFIAVFGAYRDLESAQWRAYTAIPLNKTTPMTIGFSKTSIDINLPVEDE